MDVTAMQRDGVLKNGEKVTKTGKLFYDTIKVRNGKASLGILQPQIEGFCDCLLEVHICISFKKPFQSISRLNNRCHPDMMMDFVEHGEHDPEEFPFMEEVQAMKVH